MALSTSAYFRSLVDYQLALRDLHREKGSLLNYVQVGLSESEWAGPAYRDAYQHGQYLAPVADPSRVTQPSPVTSGPFNPSEERPQFMMQPEVLGESVPAPTSSRTGAGADASGSSESGTGGTGKPAVNPPGSAGDNQVPVPPPGTGVSFEPNSGDFGSLRASPFNLP